MASKFGFASIGHFFAALGHDIHVAATWMKKQEPVIDKALDTATEVVTLADPALAGLDSLIDRAGKSLLGDAVAVAMSLDSAAAAKGASLVLDAATIAELKQMGADMQAATKSTVPIGLPVIAPTVASA